MANSSSPTSTSPRSPELGHALVSCTLNGDTLATHDTSLGTGNNNNNLNTTSNVLVNHVLMTHAANATSNVGSSNLNTILSSAVNTSNHTPMDIKILPAGLIQLAANLSAVYPANGVQKQIAIQILREDG